MATEEDGSQGVVFFYWCLSNVWTMGKTEKKDSKGHI